MMRISIFIVLFSLVTFQSSAQAVAPNPVAVVQQQLDTYNDQDLEAFVNLFAEDAQLFSNLGDATPTMQGREEIRQRYGAMFEKYPENYSTLTGRMMQGNYVLDHEWVTGRDEDLSIIAIYEVNDGLITRCWFVR